MVADVPDEDEVEQDHQVVRPVQTARRAGHGDLQGGGHSLGPEEDERAVGMLGQRGVEEGHGRAGTDPGVGDGVEEKGGGFRSGVQGEGILHGRCRVCTEDDGMGLSRGGGFASRHGHGNVGRTAPSDHGGSLGRLGAVEPDVTGRDEAALAIGRPSADDLKEIVLTGHDGKDLSGAGKRREGLPGGLRIGKVDHEDIPAGRIVSR